MNKSFNIPFVIAALVSLHITMFSVALQLNLLVIDSLTAKVASWALSAFSWWVVYFYRPRPQLRQRPVTIRRTVR
ncbi:MAG: hypothetical protein KGL17_02920 [Betaproteobacteria bacterium]|nr:hypothetical protein [Betaproteobacteria bacterium]MDE2212598.1 hypothetical protein [Betaproteobacteria bacterium]MDE2353953.1 hypothetical protein [Betaproteobacteria bacterium]MDE2625489.1 hypothetical protein [Betaproteobacteria bacterium]